VARLIQTVAPSLRTRQVALQRAVVKRCGRKLCRCLREMLSPLSVSTSPPTAQLSPLESSKALLCRCALNLLLGLPSSDSSSSSSSSSSSEGGGGGGGGGGGIAVESFVWITDEILTLPRLRYRAGMEPVLGLLEDGVMTGWAAVLEQGLAPHRIALALTAVGEAAVLGNLGAFLGGEQSRERIERFLSVPGNHFWLVRALRSFVEDCPLAALVVSDHLDLDGLEETWQGTLDWDDASGGDVGSSSCATKGARRALEDTLLSEGQTWAAMMHSSRSMSNGPIIVDREGLMGLINVLTDSGVTSLLVTAAARECALGVKENEMCAMEVDVEADEWGAGIFSRLTAVYGRVLVHTMATSVGTHNKRAVAILNSLAYGGSSSGGAPLVVSLWSILDRMEWDSIRVSTMDEATEGPVWTLYLLCLVLQRQLASIDDEEFHGRGPSPSPTLSLQAMGSLLHRLNGLLYKLYWTDANEGALSNALGCNQLVQAATALYNHLYVRNSRRNFVDTSDLTWEHVHLTDLKPESMEDGGEIFGDAATTGDGDSSSFRDPRAQCVLTTIPHVVDFKLRVKLFHIFLVADRRRSGGADQQSFFGVDAPSVVHRANLVLDGFQLLNQPTSKLKGRLQVAFVSEQNTREPGIDGGGLFKEFVEKFIQATFDPEYGLWKSTTEGFIVPNPLSGSIFSRGSDDLLSNDLFLYELLGKLLGKVMYESILVDMEFGQTFLNRMLGNINHFNDLATLDEDMYRSLLKLKHMGAAGQDLSLLGLTFSATVDASTGRSIDLVQEGSELAVTNENFREYLFRLANHKLNIEGYEQTKYFMQGFQQVISADLIRLFSAQELKILINGDRRAFDMDDMKRHVKYQSGYHPSQPYVQDFWDIVEKMSPDDQGAFLKFCTSASRQPILGFGQLGNPNPNPNPSPDPNLIPNRTPTGYPTSAGATGCRSGRASALRQHVLQSAQATQVLQ